MARRARGWSQERLARETKLSRNTIADMENGNTPQLRTARRVAQVLDSSVDVLFPPAVTPPNETAPSAAERKRIRDLLATGHNPHEIAERLQVLPKRIYAVMDDLRAAAKEREEASG